MNDADRAWTAANDADVDALDRSGLDDVLVAIRLARSRLDAIEVRTARRLRTLAVGAGHGGSSSTEHAIARGGGKGGRDAKDVTERDELCEEHPELEDALDAGDVTAAHLDAINAAARPLPDDVRVEFLTHADELMRRAGRVSLDAFRRECRQLAKHLLAVSRRGLDDTDELEAQRAASTVTRWVDRSDGMCHTHLELDPVRDAKLQAAINRALGRRRAERSTGRPGESWQQTLVDATVDALTGDDRGATSPPDAANDGFTGDVERPDSTRTSVDRVPDISIVVNHDVLLGVAAENGLCETVDGTPLPVCTVRRLCCDAEILPTVMGGPSAVLDQGRGRRTASPDQRRALRTMYATCAHPQCSVGFDACRIHHVDHWLEHRGPTDLHNLLPLCERDHHTVHEGRWTLRPGPDRTHRWIRPDGSASDLVSSPDRRGFPVSSDRERAML